MSTLQEPPSPDLSKTFWTPPFPSHRENAVRRAHPIPKWGDYNPITGQYLWQNERCKGNSTEHSNYVSKIKNALISMWYGVENNPRCNNCERADRLCTRVMNDAYGGAACARCRIHSRRDCSFAHGGRGKSGHKRQRLIVQDDSDDDLPIKTILDRRRTKDRHEVNTTEAPLDGPQVDGQQDGNLPRTFIEIPDSPSLSSLFCTPSGTPPVSRPTTPPGNQALLSKDNSNSGCVGTCRGGHGSKGGYHGAQSPTEGPPINAPKGPRAMREVVSNRSSYPAGGKAQIEERLCALEAENNRYRAEQGLGRDRIAQLEEQISLLGQQQDHKLKQAILDIREMVNHAINQMITR